MFHIAIVSSILIIINILGIIIPGFSEPWTVMGAITYDRRIFGGGVACECYCCICLLCLWPSSTSTICYSILLIPTYACLDVVLLFILVLVLWSSTMHLASVIMLLFSSIVPLSIFACFMLHVTCCIAWMLHFESHICKNDKVWSIRWKLALGFASCAASTMTDTCTHTTNF